MAPDALNHDHASPAAEESAIYPGRLPLCMITYDRMTLKIIQRMALGMCACAVLIAPCALLSAEASSVSAPLPFPGHGSIGEAYVIGADPGSHLTVVNGGGTKVGGGVVDRLGSLIVRNLAPGSGYRFEEGSGADVRTTAAFSVLSPSSTPSAAFYSSQKLHAGLNYVRMRDGILLAVTVRLPPGKTLADGPFPTVIEYSGYAVSASPQLDQHAGGQRPTE